MADLKSKLEQKATGGEVAKRPATMGESIQSFLEANAGELAKALPKHVTVDRLNRLAVSTINRTPLLAQCTKASLIGGIVISSQLGLELNTPLGHAYLIPYKRSAKTPNGWEEVHEAQFQLGYAGLIDLAYRTGLFTNLYCEPVYENDEFDYAYGMDKHLTHKPTDGDPGPLKGIYAVFHLQGGGKDFKYWPVEKIRQHAIKYSKSWDSKNNCFKKGSAWADSFEGMARVPVIKDLLKLAPKSIEFREALAHDGAVKAEIKEDMLNASNVPAELEVEYTVVDTSTGEVPLSEEEAAAAQEQAPPQ